jgi:hypothetical protein
MPDNLTRGNSGDKSQQSVRVDPVAESETPGEDVERINLSFETAWITAVLPLLGVPAAPFFYRAGYRRLAFQSLVLGLWGFMPFALAARANGYITLLGLFALIPLALINFLRRMDSPINTPAIPPLTPNQPFNLNTYVRARLVWFGYAAAFIAAFYFLIWSHPSLLNVLFILLSIPTILAPIALVTVTIMLIRSATGWRPKVKWVDRHLIVFAAFLTFILVLTVGTERAEQVARHHMTALVPVLERYHADHGAHPEKLTALVPSYLDEKPQCFGSGGSNVNYFRHDNDGYNLVCFIFVFLRVSYDSATQKWEVYD